MDWKSKPFKPVFQGLIILLIGLAGGILFDSLGISAGLFMGCMLFSGFYRFVVKSEIALTGIYNQLGQIIFGMLIGTSFRQENLETMKLATLPILFQIIVLVSAGFLMGMLLSRLTPLDRSTSILSSLPGGLPVMTSLAEDLKQNVGIVAVVHYFRLTIIVLTMPLLMPFLGLLEVGAKETGVVSVPMDFNGYLLLGLIGVVTFVLNHRIRFPGGHMLFGMVISGSIHLFIYPFGDMDGIVKLIAIVFLSVSIGSKITLETILLLRKVILPAGCIIITLVTLGLVLGVLLHKLTAIDLNTALLSSVPGGAASLTAIADELGADMRIVGSLHLYRLILLAVLTPPLFFLFNRKKTV